MHSMPGVAIVMRYLFFIIANGILLYIAFLLFHGDNRTLPTWLLIAFFSILMN